MVYGQMVACTMMNKVMNLKNLTTLLQYYDDSQPQFKIEVSKNCKECQKISKFKTDEIPGLYESLIG